MNPFPKKVLSVTLLSEGKKASVVEEFFRRRLLEFGYNQIMPNR